MISDSSKHELEERREIFLKLRDKHLAQFMAINTRAVFVVVGLVISMLIGMEEKVKAIAQIKEPSRIIALILFVLGAVLLAAAAIWMALFHTRRIRDLQEKCLSVPAFSSDDFIIVPPDQRITAFTVTALGVISLAGSVILLLISRII